MHSILQFCIVALIATTPVLAQTTTSSLPDSVASRFTYSELKSGYGTTHFGPGLQKRYESGKFSASFRNGNLGFQLGLVSQIYA